MSNVAEISPLPEPGVRRRRRSFGPAPPPRDAGRGGLTPRAEARTRRGPVHSDAGRAHRAVGALPCAQRAHAVGRLSDADAPLASETLEDGRRGSDPFGGGTLRNDALGGDRLG